MFFGYLFPFLIGLNYFSSALFSIPNIDQIGRGIDLFKSDPNAKASDPGLRIAIFNLDCESCYSKNFTFNNLYRVPDGVSFRPDPHCSYASQATVIHDTFGYQKTLDYTHTKKKHILFWHHTSTESFHYVEQMTGDMNFVLVQSKASCGSYQAQLDSYELDSTQLNPSFIYQVLKLPPVLNASTLSSYGFFVDTFGTHHLTQMVMGASATVQTWFKQVDYTLLKRQNYDIHSAASLAFLEKFGAGDWIKKHKSYSDYVAFKNKTYSSPEPTWIPRAPPSDPDVSISSNLWAKDVQLPKGEAGIISYQYEPISSLLSSHFFNSSVDPKIKLKALSLQLYIDTQYCKRVKCGNVTRNGRWDKLNLPMISPRAGHSSVVLNNITYVIGGDEIIGHSNQDTSLMLNDTTWFYIAPPQTVTHYGTITVLRGDIFVIGGYEATGKTSSAFVALYRLSLREWVKQTPLSVARFRLIAETINDKIYAIGGCTFSGTTYTALDINEVYHPDTQIWQNKTTMPIALYGHTSVVYNQKIYVIGGLPEANKVLIYSPNTDSWSMGNPIPPNNNPRWAHSSVLIGHLIYILGGLTPHTKNPSSLDDVSVYDVVRKSWAPSAPMYSYRYDGTATVLPGDQDLNETNIHWMGGFDGSPQKQSRPSNLHMIFTIPNESIDQNEVNLGKAIPLINLSDISVKKEKLPKRTQKMDDHIRQLPLPVFPGIDYLSYGYNILRGNPFGQTLDEGWTAQGTFDIACPDCFTQNKSFVGQWMIPDGVSVDKLESCSYHADTFVIRDGLNLQATLDAYAKVKAHAGIPILMGFRFSASLGVHTMVKMMAETDATFVGASASCEAYRISLNTYESHTNYWTNFKEGLISLPSTFDATKPWPWLDFVEAFGTHMPVSIVMGGRATMLSVVENANYRQMLEADLDIHAASHASFIFIFGSSNKVSGKFHFHQYEQFSEKVNVNWTSCAPVCPPHREDVLTNSSAWAEEVLLPSGNPVPIGVELVPITTIINSSSFLASFPTYQRSAIGNQLSNLLTFFNQPGNASYCSLVPGCGTQIPLSGWERENSQLPTACSGFMAGVVDDVMLVAGGTSDGLSAMPTLNRLNIGVDGSPWQIGMSMHQARFFAGSAVVDSLFYVFGGLEDGGKPLNTSEMYNITSFLWHPQADMPHARSHIATTAIGKQVFLLGGKYNNTVVYNTALVYDTSKRTWKLMHGKMTNGGRYGSVAATVGNTIYLCGGIKSNSVFPTSEVLVYHYLTDSWDILQMRLPYPRYLASTISIPNQRTFLVIGGVVTSLNGSQHNTSSVLQFQEDASGFVRLPDLVVGLAASGAFFHNGSVHVLGGSTNNGTPTTSSYSLHNLDIKSPSFDENNCQAQQLINQTRSKLPRSNSSDISSSIYGSKKYAIFPLSDLANHGYNRIKGQPSASLTDPGWAIQPVLDLACPTCFTEGKIYNDKFLVPNSLELNYVADCSYADNVWEIHDTQTIQTEFSKMVKFRDDIGIPILLGFEFVGSEFYQKIQERTLSSNVVYVLGHAKCITYQIDLDITGTLPFTSNFMEALLSLPSKLDPHNLNPWFEFVETFGTHLPTTMHIGAEALQSSVFLSSDFNYLQRNHVDIRAGARASILFLFGLKFRGGMDIDLIAYNNFSSHFTANTTYCKPTCPPSGPNVNDNTTSWKIQLGDDRGIPVQYELISIPRLIKMQLKKKAFPTHMHNVITFTNENLINFLNDYYCDLLPQCRAASTVPFWTSTTLPHMNVPRTDFAFGLLADQLFVVGGRTTAKLLVNTVQAYDMHRGVWQTMQSMKDSRAFATGSVIGNLLIIVGGCTNCSEALNSAVVLSTADYSWKDIAPMTKPRQLHGAVVLKQTLYVIGGFSGNAKGIIHGDTEVYSVSKNNWISLGFNLSVPRYAASVAVIGSGIIVAGGIHKIHTAPFYEVSDVVELITPGSGLSWKTLIPLGSPRCHAMALIRQGSADFRPGPKLLVIGGLTKLIGSPTDSVLQYEPITGLTTKQPSTIQKVSAAGTYVVDKTQGYMVGGSLVHGIININVTVVNLA